MNMRQVEHKHMWKEGSADHDYMPSLGPEWREQRKAQCAVLIPNPTRYTVTPSLMTCNLSDFSLTLKIWKLLNRKLHDKLCCIFPGWWATASLSSDSACALVDLKVEILCCSDSFSRLPFRAWSKDLGVQGGILRECERTGGVLWVLLRLLESRARETVFPWDIKSCLCFLHCWYAVKDDGK